jgi:hypothetical protein
MTFLKEDLDAGRELMIDCAMVEGEIKDSTSSF